MRFYLKYVAAPIMLIAMSLIVVGTRSRNLMLDKICLLVIFALSLALCLQKRWLVLLALGYSAVLCFANIEVFNMGRMSGIWKYCAESRFPPPRKFNLQNFMDVHEYHAHAEIVSKEVAIYDFFAANVVVLLLCLVADKAIQFARCNHLRRSHRRVKESI